MGRISNLYLKHTKAALGVLNQGCFWSGSLPRSPNQNCVVQVRWGSESRSKESRVECFWNGGPQCKSGTLCKAIHLKLLLKMLLKHCDNSLYFHLCFVRTTAIPFTSTRGCCEENVNTVLLNMLPYFTAVLQHPPVQLFLHFHFFLCPKIL